MPLLTTNTILLATTSVVATLLASSTSSSSFVSASPDYKGDPCTFNWDGPQLNADESFSCARDWNDSFPRWLNFENNWMKLLPTALTFLTGLFIFFVIPFVMICRYCCFCCGSSKATPGEGCCPCGKSENDELPEKMVLAKYSQSEIRATKIFTIITVILALAGTGVAVHGSINVGNGVQTYRTGSLSMTNWIEAKLTQIETAITDPSATNGGTAFPDTTTVINSIKSKMFDWKNTVTGNDEQIEIAQDSMLGLAFPAFFVFLLSVCAGLCALCNVRKYVPMILLIILAFAALVAGTLGSTAAAVSFVEDVYCGETNAWQNNETGLISWYIIPNICEKQLKFGELKTDIKFELQTSVDSLCEALYYNCDNNPHWDDRVGYDTFYYCPTTPLCNTPEQLNHTIRTMKVKLGIPNNGLCEEKECTILDCVDKCNPFSETEVQPESATLASSSSVASSTHEVLHKVIIPELNCNSLVKRTVEEFSDICENDQSTTGSGTLFSGYAVALSASLVLMIVLFLGQKRYIDSSERNRYFTAASADLLHEHLSLNNQQEATYGSVVVAATASGKEEPIEF